MSYSTCIHVNYDIENEHPANITLVGESPFDRNVINKTGNYVEHFQKEYGIVAGDLIYLIKNRECVHVYNKDKLEGCDENPKFEIRGSYPTKVIREESSSDKARFLRTFMLVCATLAILVNYF
jgi:hypothetical protein